MLSQLKSERARAPAKLDAANKRLAEAREDISTVEAKLGEISEKLAGIDFDEIAQRERRRNELKERAERHEPAHRCHGEQHPLVAVDQGGKGARP